MVYFAPSTRNFMWLSIVGMVGLLLSVVFVERVWAQQINPMAGAYIELSPQYPLAGDSVTVELKTASLDEMLSEITWKINGEIVAQGYGKKTYEFVAGRAGDAFAIEVTATPPRGPSVRATHTVRVSDVAFTWEGLTYTPPFFQGQALVSQQSEVVVVALPTVYDGAGKLYDPDTLFYEWMLNGTKIPEKSGRGARSVTLATSKLYEDFGVTLTIKDASGEVRVFTFFRIPVSEPRIVFYEDNPLFGIAYARALADTVSIAGEELRIVAEPYYTSAQTRADEHLLYEWRLGSDVLSSPGSLVLRLEGIGEGSSDLDLTVVNNAAFKQRIREHINIFYGGSRGGTPATQPL